MPISGYDNKGQPNVAWWIEQIKLAEKFREKWAYSRQWDAWRGYYRGDYKADTLPVNVFFSYLRSLVPRTYFRNPAVSVTPEKPGFLEMAFARVVGRVDNKMIHSMNLRREAKRMVQDTFILGTGVGKLGFGGQFSVNPAASAGGGAPDSDKTGKVEYHPDVRANLPWFMRVSPGRFLVPTKTDVYESSRWVAEEIFRTKEDVADDERFNKEARENVRATRKMGDDNDGPEMVHLYEVRDLKTGKVLVLSPFSDDMSPSEGGGANLYCDIDPLIADGRFNYFPIVFNPDDEVFWGLPDAKILEPYQLEINEIRTQTMKHRRLALVKLLVKEGVITESEIAKMLSTDVGAVVKVKEIGPTAIDKMQIANIPQDLILAGQQVMQDIRDTLGFSRNQMGEFASRRGDTTAEEVETVREATDIRIDEKRDEMAHMITRMVEKMNSILFKRWGGDQVLDVVGPGGAKVWVRFDPRNLTLAHYNIRVDPDTAVPKNRRAREERAVRAYEILKSNPLIDPVKLTQFLLGEVEGVEMDDLMRALPEIQAGLNPGQPIGIEGLAGLLSQSVGQAQRGAPPGDPRIAALIGAGGGR